MYHGKHDVLLTAPSLTLFGVWSRQDAALERPCVVPTMIKSGVVERDRILVAQQRKIDGVVQAWVCYEQRLNVTHDFFFFFFFLGYRGDVHPLTAKHR